MHCTPGEKYRYRTPSDSALHVLPRSSGHRTARSLAGSTRLLPTAASGYCGGTGLWWSDEAESAVVFTSVRIGVWSPAVVPTSAAGLAGTLLLRISGSAVKSFSASARSARRLLPRALSRSGRFIVKTAEWSNCSQIRPGNAPPCAVVALRRGCTRCGERSRDRRRACLAAAGYHRRARRPAVRRAVSRRLRRYRWISSPDGWR